jgi:hypothetical protein
MGSTRTSILEILRNANSSVGVLRSCGSARCLAAYPGPRRGQAGAKPYQRRALALLAGCGSGGCTERVMRMHGFTAYELAELVRLGYTTTTTERVGRGIERQTQTITEAGERALGLRNDGIFPSVNGNGCQDARTCFARRPSAHLRIVRLERWPPCLGGGLQCSRSSRGSQRGPDALALTSPPPCPLQCPRCPWRGPQRVNRGRATYALH